MSGWFLSPAANLDIDRAWIYIYERNPKAADDIVAEIYAAFDIIAENPRIGRERPELLDVPRSFPLSDRPYIIFYRSLDTGIRIIRVIHASQDINRAY